MQVNHLVVLTVVAVVLLTAVVQIGISAGRRGNRLRRSLTEAEGLRSRVADLEIELAELRQAPGPCASQDRQFIPAPVMTADQRASALDMIRHGADAAAVSAATGLSRAEAQLLQRLQQLHRSSSPLAKAAYS